VRGGTPTERFVAVSAALDSKNIENGIRLTKNVPSYIKKRKKLVRYIVDEYLLKPGSSTSFACPEMSYSSVDLIDKLIYLTMYSVFSPEFGRGKFIEKDLIKLRGVILDRINDKPDDSDLYREYLSKWPYIYNHD